MGRFAKQRLTAEERAVIRLKRHTHLRQVKQSYVHRDSIHGEFFHAGDNTLAKFLAMLDGKGPILVASNDRHVRTLEQAKFSCVYHAEQMPDPDDLLLGRAYRKPDAAGPLNKLKFSAPLKGAFVCERLQKQANVHDYLVALRKSVEIDAPIALVVPNVHHELVNDHINLFTAGTLVYNLVRAGWNCRDATVTYDKRFINLIVRRSDVPEPVPTKVDDLTPFVPFRNVFNYCSSEFPEVYR